MLAITGLAKLHARFVGNTLTKKTFALLWTASMEKRRRGGGP